MRLPRVRVPRPWRWRPGRTAPDEDAAASLARQGADEDQRLLGRTRLRLMVVSGVVTLLILVVLGALVYRNTADALANDSIKRLASPADQLQARLQGQGRPPPSPYAMTLGDDAVPFILDAQGQPLYGPR